MHAVHPKIAKEFDKKTKDFKSLPEHADGSASDSALFKEDLPKKMIIQDLWMNKHETPPEKGRQLEAAEEGGTLMGRLSARMASRDMIDELDMGPKGRSPEAKKAQVADGEPPGKMRIEGPALKTGIKIEKEHTSDPKEAKKIALDHLKEYPKYYDKKIGLPAMEKKLKETADYSNQIPSKLVISSGLGLNEQTTDKKASNMSDPIQNTKPRKGKNMAEQAKNAGNIFDTMHKNGNI